MTGYQAVKKIRNKRTKGLKEAFGGKCIICGYNKSYRSLSFHHINSEDKEFTLSNTSLRKWSEMIKEAEKCVLLCSNCHMEYHDGMIDKSLLIEKRHGLIINYDLLNSISPKRQCAEKELICLQCDKHFISKSALRKYCSPGCSSTAQRKYASRPPKYLLQEYIKDLGYVGTGRKFGVSDNTIRKWIAD